MLEIILSAATVVLLQGVANTSALDKRPIPTEAQTVIHQVRDAAKARDFQALRRLMVSEFTWSFGGDGDADQAIQAWKQDLAALGELYRIASHQCAFSADERHIQCPPKAGYNYRAGFTKTEQGWRMVYFVAGD